VPVTDLDADTRLLQIVERIALRQKAEITLVYVVEVMQSMPLDAELPTEVSQGEQVLREAEEHVSRHAEVKRSIVSTELLQARSAGAAIVDEAIDRNANVILMSARLQRKRGQLTIGDTVDYVLKNAPCEVLLIRQEMPDWLLKTMELGLE
jgi:nucleotide-binding universal stress UspA family protein